MFKNEYQGGPYFEIFSVQGKDPVANWKLTGSSGIRKSYDKEVKSYIYTLEGHGATTKMQLPKDSKQTLTLVQRYLIFQICVPKGQDFAVEIGLTDLSNSKRRLLLSTAHKEVGLTPLHAKIPLNVIKRATWMNLCLDMVSFVGEAWKNQTFKAVENIILCANCKLRRIFTMKMQPPDTTDEGYISSSPCDIDSVPRQCQLPTDVIQVTQVLSLSFLKNPDVRRGDLTHRPGSAAGGETELNSSRKGSAQDCYRIAFGSKVPAPALKKSTIKDGNTTTRHSKTLSTLSGSGKLRCDDVVVGSSNFTDGSKYGSHRRMLSDPTSHLPQDLPSHIGNPITIENKTWSKSSESAVIPHPPRQPSGDKARRRPRVKSAGKERPSSGSRESISGIEDSRGSSSGGYSVGAPTNRYRSHNLSSGDDEYDATKPLENRKQDQSIPVSSIRQNETSSEHDDFSGDSDEEFFQKAKKSLSKYAAKIDDNGRQYSNDDVRLDDSISLQHENENIPEPVAGTYKSGSMPDNYDEDANFKHSRLKSKSKVARHNSPTASRSQPIRRKTPSPQPAQLLPIQNSRKSPHTSQQLSHFLNASSNHVKVTVTSDDLNSARSTVTSQSQVRQSISKKSLREIPRSDARLSKIPDEKYDFAKYQMDDLTESFEAQLMASMKRQADEDLAEMDENDISRCKDQNLSPTSKKSTDKISPLRQQLVYGGESASSSDEDTTSLSTWKNRSPNLNVHHYQDEMNIHASRTSSDTLGSSNPRDWSGVFSPPIVLSSDLKKSTTAEQPMKSSATFGVSGVKQSTNVGETADQLTDEEDELDLLYDPCLNCYFDPKSCKYYELV